MPVAVAYSLTALGLSLNKLLEELLAWGIHFREEMVGR
jgi:DNA-binding HxlR family transcriptional regulator